MAVEGISAGPMKARLFLITISLGAAVGFGCGGSTTVPGELPLGQSFELQPGTSATLQGGLEVAFDAVRSDSRCPMDALCVWAGEGIVAVRLSQSGSDQAERELKTAPSGSEATYGSYSITLITLQPYPRSDRAIQPNDYVATFTVNAR
jgi:hypothetical protein